MNTMSNQMQHFQELMEKWAEGCSKAAEEIIDLYSPYILRAVRIALPQKIRSKVDSMDLVQSIWLSLLTMDQEKMNFQTPEQFIGFLSAMTRNSVCDRFRAFTTTQARSVQVEQRWDTCTESKDSKGLRVEIPAHLTVSDRHPSPSQIAIWNEKWSRFSNESDERDRSIVSLRMDGLSYIAIAEKLEIGEKTVRRRLAHMYELLTE